MILLSSGGSKGKCPPPDQIFLISESLKNIQGQCPPTTSPGPAPAKSWLFSNSTFTSQQTGLLNNGLTVFDQKLSTLMTRSHCMGPGSGQATMG